MNCFGSITEPIEERIKKKIDLKIEQRPRDKKCKSKPINNVKVSAIWRCTMKLYLEHQKDVLVIEKSKNCKIP